MKIHIHQLKPLKENDLNFKLFSIISFLFIGWGIWFIYRSSFIADDGSRYFLIFDDGMISFRYALNIVNGIGPVWNSGEYIEGFSNPLWTLIMSINIYLFGQNIAPLMIQLIGLILLVTSSFYIYRISAILTRTFQAKESFFTLFPSILFFSYYPISYWSIGGMEVSLLVFLTILLTYFILKHIYFKYDNSIYVKLFILISIAYLTRPDGFLIMLPLSIMLFFSDYKNKLLSIKKLFNVMIFLFTILVVLSLRFYIYGDIVPNTFHLKIDGYDLFWRLRNGIGFISPYIKEISLFILINTILSLYLFIIKKNTLWFWLLLLPLTSIIYQVYVGGDPWDRWRQLSPSIFILFLSTAIIPIFIPKNIYYKSLYIGIIISAFSLSNYPFFKEQLQDSLYSFNTQKKQVQFALHLNQITNKKASIGVFWAGTIPYYFQGRAIDFLGKCDHKISHLKPHKSPSWKGMIGVPGHSKYNLNYTIKQLSPDWIQKYKWYEQNLKSYAKTHYVKLKYNKQTLPGCFKKNSVNIDWKKLVIISQCK